MAATRIPEVRYALRAFLCEQPDPAQALERVNRFLCGRHEEHLPEQFVALSLVVVNCATGEATSVAAGVEPPLVFRAQGGVESLMAGQLALGILSEQKYKAMPFRMHSGGILMLLMDGLTELRQGKEKRSPFLGYEGLTALAERAISPTLARQSTLRQSGQVTLDQAKALCGGTFHDDVCLLLTQWQ